MNENDLFDIPLNEWELYEWTPVSDKGVYSRVFLRGKKKTQPPQDGYAYVRVDGPGEPEYRWARARELIE